MDHDQLIDQLIDSRDMSVKRRLPLIGMAALLFVFAFPPFGYGAVGFVALVPFHFAVRDAGAPKGVALGFLFGAITNFVMFRWLLRADVVHLHHLMIFAAYLGIYSALLGGAWAKIGDRASGILILPLVAAVLDWARGHAGFLACPWMTLGQTQHANIALLQLASVGGEHLVTMVVVAANVAVAQLLSGSRKRRQRAAIAVASVGLLHLVGWTMLTLPEGRTVTVALVQPHLAPGDRRDDTFTRLDTLTQTASALKPDLIVWPESAAGDIDGDTLALFQTRAIVDRGGVPVLFGSSNVRRGEEGHNSLAFMRPGEPMPEPYRKMHLIAFAEYVPRGIPGWFGPRLFTTIPGTVRHPFDLDGIAVVPIICVESLFADDVRRSTPDAPGLLAVAVNDAWFGDSAAAPLHNLVSVFRAVENRRPVVIASNGGPSEIIDPNGRVIARTPALVEATLSAKVRVDAPRGLYARW